MKKLLNIVFVAHLVFFTLVITGVIPRSAVLWETIVIALYLTLTSVEEGALFFVRSIPLFIAIPLTTTFDNFNQWRIFSLVIFSKWFFCPSRLSYIWSEAKIAFRKPIEGIRRHPVAAVLKLLLLLALISWWAAPDTMVGLKRTIYFLNASLIGVVIWYCGITRERLIKNLIVPTLIVTIAGLVQLITTYMGDIYYFVDVWGFGIQMRQFGEAWSHIATHVGNTWFAYFGDQLSLRMFSLFPDSHSFPIFLLLGLPALFAWTLKKPLAQEGLKKMFRTRGSLNVLWIPVVLLCVILSGTRGFWAGAVALIVWIGLVLAYMQWQKATREKKNIFKYVASYLILFVLLFPPAYAIVASPQFLISKGDSLLLQKRLRSTLDFNETSNAERIRIWKESLNSIADHPITGVGIGRFPVVLEQDVNLSDAGSSAHNIYLHIAAEMGIIALLGALYFIWLLFKKIYDNFIGARSARNEFFILYSAAALLTLPWIFAYLMTDVALFDERALLFFAVTVGLIFKKD